QNFVFAINMEAITMIILRPIVKSTLSNRVANIQITETRGIAVKNMMPLHFRIYQYGTDSSNPILFEKYNPTRTKNVKNNKISMNKKNKKTTNFASAIF